jgi:hypothetical protein
LVGQVERSDLGCEVSGAVLVFLDEQVDQLGADHVTPGMVQEGVQHDQWRARLAGRVAPRAGEAVHDHQPPAAVRRAPPGVDGHHREPGL